MPKRKWTAELVVEQIRALHKKGEDLTTGAAEARNGPLVSAGERYFGNWPKALEAAGLDAASIKAIGRQRRVERISKWSRGKIISELRRLHSQGEDLSWSNMERKYQALCAAAVKKAYFGSWSKALDAAGVDYAEIKKRAREARRWRGHWRRELVEQSEAGGLAPLRARRARLGTIPTARPGWARQLLEEAKEEQREEAR
jgi:hypothetical protein